MALYRTIENIMWELTLPIPNKKNLLRFDGTFPPPNQKGTQDAHKHVQLLFYLAHDQANEYDDSIDGLLESLLGGRLGG